MVGLARRPQRRRWVEASYVLAQYDLLKRRACGSVEDPGSLSCGIS